MVPWGDAIALPAQASGLVGGQLGHVVPAVSMPGVHLTRNRCGALTKGSRVPEVSEKARFEYWGEINISFQEVRGRKSSHLLPGTFWT